METTSSPAATPTPLQELRGLVRLAVPLASTHLGQMLLGAVDTAVVGRYGEAELGAAGLGNSVYFVLQVFGIGVMLGLDPLIAQAIGAGERERARRLLWQGIWIALFVGAPLVVCILAAGAALELLGTPATTAALTRDYLVWRVASVMPYLVFGAARSYLQALGRTRPLVWGVLVANVVNLPVSWALVFGDPGIAALGGPALGIPEMGVAGAALTSSVCTLVQLGFALDGMRRADDTSSRGLRRPDRDLLRRALRLGLPIGLAMLAEVGIFAFVNVAMANIGKRALAAHQIAITLAATTFMIPLGIGAATAVRVGHAVGRGDVPGTRLSGAVGLATGLAFMSCSAVTFWAAPSALASVISDVPEVVEAAVPLVFVAAVFQLSDGAQAVAAGALRGAGDTRFVLWANLCGHYLLGIPVSLALGFGTALGPPGLWWGLSVGLTVVGIVLATRFFRLARRPIARA